jgi:hypothetical protein
MGLTRRMRTRQARKSSLLFIVYVSVNDYLLFLKCSSSKLKVQGANILKVEKFEDLEIWKEVRVLCKYIFELN